MNGTLKRLRELQALSQRDLAEKSGVSLATVNRAEKGIRRPSPRTIRKLATALGATPEVLITQQMPLL